MALTYKDAGVDQDAGDALVDRIKPLAKRVRIAEVLDDIGGFAGLCALPSGMANPVLVSGTDGVGTKLSAFATDVHDIGIDLTAMCVNDILTTGARSLFFSGLLCDGQTRRRCGGGRYSGVAEGCAQSSCALLGGETAELPGMYAPGTYDLAGFAVGVVDREKLIDGRRVESGDVVIAVASSGLHSNGYSLARKIANQAVGDDLGATVESLGSTVGAALLTPTRIYAKAVRSLLSDKELDIRAFAHITGGGLPGNLPRVLPDGLGARLDLRSYERPPLFAWLAANGPVEEAEMRKTFNLGVGVVVPKPSVARALQVLEESGERAWQLGEVIHVGDVPFEERVMFAGDAS
jgi:phosphoribosylformylglycinamidine cyclo-ligase